MKKLKLSLILAFSIGCIIVIAQTGKEKTNTPAVGTGKAMEENLNFPNAINPAKDNNQDHERKNSRTIKTDHPKKNLSNSYNRSSYETTKKDSVKH